LELIKKQKLKNIHLENILAAAFNPESNMSKEIIYSFFEEIENEGKKNKQSFFPFSLDQLRNGLKN